MADFDVKMDIKGLEDVLKKLEQMEPKLKKRAVKNATGKAASIIRRAATKAAPKKSGAMAKNIRVQFAPKETRKTGDVTFRVGVRGGARRPSQGKFDSSSTDRQAVFKSTWYWRLVEFGTQKMPARPFMRKAMVNSTERVFNQIATHLDKAIEKYTKTGDAE